MKFKEVLFVLHKLKKKGKTYYHNCSEEDGHIPYGYTRVNKKSLGPKKFYLELLENHSSGFIITNKYIKYLDNDSVLYDSTKMDEQDYFNLMVMKPDILSLDELKYLQNYARSFKPKFYYVNYTLIISEKFCNLLEKEY